MHLDDQHVAVLGGTSGIGLAAAALAAERGARVTVVSSRPESARHALATLPAGTTAETADLTDSRQVTALFDRGFSGFSSIDNACMPLSNSTTP